MLGLPAHRALVSFIVLAVHLDGMSPVDIGQIQPSFPDPVHIVGDVRIPARYGGRILHHVGIHVARTVPGDANAADGNRFVRIGPRSDRYLVIDVVAVFASLDFIIPGQGPDDMFRSPPVVGIIYRPGISVQFDIDIQKRNFGRGIDSEFAVAGVYDTVLSLQAARHPVLGAGMDLVHIPLRILGKLHLVLPDGHIRDAAAHGFRFQRQDRPDFQE